ncbi:MAG: hypothetical protein AAGU12_04750 [Clostridiales bacterium]
MAWKLSLFGYQESEVNEYLQTLSQARGAEVASLREKVRLAMETNIRQDITLADLRREAAERKNRLKAVESRLILIYYRMLLNQSSEAVRDGTAFLESEMGPSEKYLRQLEKREQIAAEAGKRLNALFKQIGRWEKEMEKPKNFNTSLLGVAPKDLEEYLLLRERSHQEAIADLSEKLNQLEKAIALQGEEIKALGGFLERPEMQKPFIDLAERFLQRFEQSLENVARETMNQNSRAALTERERECERREKELRLQIARCRRKVNTLLRNLNQPQKEQQSLPPSADSFSFGEVQEVLEEVEESVGAEGKGEAALETGAARTGSSAEEARNSGTAGTTTTTGTTGTAGMGNMADIADSRQSLKFRYLLGKVAGSDLAGNQGELLIKQGQSIGLQEAEAVYQQGLLDQLVRCLA